MAAPCVMVTSIIAEVKAATLQVLLLSFLGNELVHDAIIMHT